MGYIYSVCVKSIAMNNIDVETSYDNELGELPTNFSSCGYDQYEESTVCTDCDQTCSEGAGTCTYVAT
jgi:hypothetical protein